MQFRKLIPLLLACTLSASAADMPKLENKDGTFRFLVDGKPYLVLGAQVHNSSGWPDSLNNLWPAIRQLHANTIMVPVYWEAVEPEQGKFDFANIDAILQGARENNVRIAILWFGTWKNGGMDYTPAWVKSDQKTFARVIDESGHAVDAISPLCTACADADAKAFSAVMQHLKETDSDKHTVIMAQVENEAGTLGSDRDFSSMANDAFSKPVPQEVLGPLHKQGGTWDYVFGPMANEAFASYYTAKYINQVVAAGKSVYPLPIYINVWPREQSGLLRPGWSSPSGGAVSWLLDMWKAVAPAIDIIGPDNYDSNAPLFLNIANLYTRPDNPLLVPETGTSVAHARHMFYVFATPSALGISMFGIAPQERMPMPVGTGTGEGGRRRGDSDEISINYRIVGPAIPALLAARDAGHLKAAVEEDGVMNGELKFDQFDAVARFGPVRSSYSGEKGTGNPDLSGRVLIAQEAPDEFLIVGSNANIVFAPKLGDPQKHASFLSVEEGSYQNGEWHKTRLLNGDESYFGLPLPHEGATLRVKVMKY